MSNLILHLFRFFASLGGFGLLGLGILDTSFLFMPLGNDLLIIALSARNHNKMPYYAVMATMGSVLGCLLVDVVCRHLGKEKLEKLVSKKRLDYVHKKMEKRAGWALAVAALMPPPFPFTGFLMAASALEYPRTRLLSVIGAARLIRFSIAGGLAILFGRELFRLAKTPAFEWTIGAFIALCVVGSILSVVRWFRAGRGSASRAPAQSRG